MMRVLSLLLLLSFPAYSTFLLQDVPTMELDAQTATQPAPSMGWVLLNGYGSILTPFNIFVDIPSGSFLLPAVANLQVVRIFQTPNDPGFEDIGNLSFLGRVVVLSPQGIPNENTGPSMNTLYLANGAAASLAPIFDPPASDTTPPTPSEEVIAVVIPNWNLPGPNFMSLTASTGTTTTSPDPTPAGPLPTATLPPPAELPEPSTLAMLGVGAVALGLNRRWDASLPQTGSGASHSQRPS